MAVLLTPPYLQFFDDNGDPLSGGKIYTYSAGTLTPKATFTDASETTPLSNPIILDAAGRATIWISGSYYIDVRTSADVPVKNTDNITAFNTASSSINSLLPSQTGNAGKSLVTDGNNVSWGGETITILRNHIDGFVHSTAGASTTITIGAGQCSDSTNAAYITLASSLAKTTSAWVVGNGNGGLDTGSVANSTWYYFYTIRRPDTGVVDVIFSTNASTPSLPANYTQFRRIGAWKTNGSAQWDSMRQYSVGSTTKTEWLVPILTVNNSSPGTSATTVALDVPTGIAMEALVTAEIKTSSGALFGLITPLDLTDSTPSSTLFNIAGDQTESSQEMVIRTNASGQIRYRVTSGTSPIVRIVTRGFIDARVS